MAGVVSGCETEEMEGVVGWSGGGSDWGAQSVGMSGAVGGSLWGEHCGGWCVCVGGGRGV